MLQLLLGSETVARLSKRGNRVLRHLLKDSRRVLPSTLLGQLYFVILFTPSLLKFVIKMELLLSKVTQQAMNYAIRSGITITSGFAIQQCARLLKTTSRGPERTELASLQLRLETKIKIISPAIDMIELIAARGNTSLESAVTLTKALRIDIQTLGERLAQVASQEEIARRSGSRVKNAAQSEVEVKRIIGDIKRLLDRIEDAVPLINLAITTSGVSLNTSLPPTVSPSRLLQASTLLTAGDSQYAMSNAHAVQVCPDFVLSVYMLFSGHANRSHDDQTSREATWKEVIHKARLKLLRVPLHLVYDYPSDDGAPHHPRSSRAQSSLNNHAYMPGEGKAYEFAYQLLLVEDFDDDRVHSFEDDDLQPSSYEGVSKAGIRELIPVHEISKIFYADTGKILNIGTEGETNNPILLLKRDPNAIPPRRMMQDFRDEESNYQEHSSPEVEHLDEQSELDEQFRRESTPRLSPPLPTAAHPWRLPHDLDLEWIALEVYSEELAEDDSDLDESEGGFSGESAHDSRSRALRAPSTEPSVATAFSKLHLWKSSPPETAATTPVSTPSRAPSNSQLVLSPQKGGAAYPAASASPSSLPSIKTSLSLLEMLIRLTSLQQYQQTSHLAIPDELLTFFLSESSTVGAGNDNELRRRRRDEARRRVGFDPYDESPIKRRGEEYLAHASEGNFEEEAVYYDEPQSPYGYEQDHATLPRPPSSVRSYRNPSRYVGSEAMYSLGPSSPSPSTRRAGHSSSGTDFPVTGHEVPSPSTNRPSPSPLLRRATAPNVNPRFYSVSNGPPTAPPTSSSPRILGTAAAGGDGQRPTTPRTRQASVGLSGNMNTPPESK